MRIGIDYTSAAHQGAGIGRLTRNIVRALAEIDTENEYILLVQGREQPYPPLVAHPRNVASGITNANFREIRTRLDERWWSRIWHRARLPVAVDWIVGRVDVFHSPDFTLPPVRSGTRSVVTVHDLSFLRLPHCFEPALLDYLTSTVPRAIRRADWVLADSESTRRDMIELLQAPADKLSVIYPGVEPRFHPTHDAGVRERVRAKYGLPPRFILSVGTIQPRKNYVRLLEAYAGLCTTDVSLVIVGGKGWLYEGVFRRMRELELEASVMLTGFVDDGDLPVLYGLADVCVMPSLYEGFGLPLLESMACGTPVIAAHNSSFPEVVGDAGILVDATDPTSISDALDQVLGETALRCTMAQCGLARAREFTWQKAAQSLLATYQRLGGN